MEKKNRKNIVLTIFLKTRNDVTSKDSYDDYPDDISLRISLKSGLAWEPYKEELAELATEEQIGVMITHLKISIKKIKNKIVRNMLKNG